MPTSRTVPIVADAALPLAWPQLEGALGVPPWSVASCGHQHVGLGELIPRLLVDRGPLETAQFTAALRDAAPHAPLFVVASRDARTHTRVKQLVLAGVDDVFFPTGREVTRALMLLETMGRLAPLSQSLADRPPPPSEESLLAAGCVDELAAMVVEWVDRRGGLRCEAGEAARRMRMSLRTIERHLRSAGSEPLGRLLRIATVTRADSLHGEHGYSWSEVASLLGFASEAALHMTRWRVNHGGAADAL